MTKSKQKGTAAETAIVNYLHTQGFDTVERRTLSGSRDRGDIAGLRGLVVEVKNCAQLQLAAWVAEAGVEKLNDGASVGLVWHKRIGKGNPADWYVTMTGADLIELLRKAGY